MELHSRESYEIEESERFIKENRDFNCRLSLISITYQGKWSSVKKTDTESEKSDENGKRKSMDTHKGERTLKQNLFWKTGIFLDGFMNLLESVR